MKRVVFIDCGTHEGQGLSELSPLLPQGCEVHCFEANPTVVLNASTLTGIAKKAGLTPSNLVAHQVAVYDRDGTIEFASVGGFPRGTPNGRGQSSSIVYRGGTVKTTDVPCVDLLGFVRSLGLQEGDEVHIKMDIEGAEFATLKRLVAEGDDVLPYIKRMWIEWHDRYFKSGSWEKTTAVADLTKSLSERGVTVHVWK